MKAINHTLVFLCFIFIVTTSQGQNLPDEMRKTATFEPKGAEHDVYFYRVLPGEFVGGSVVINEFMASNDAAVADQDGEFDDWIELHNLDDGPMDLTGYYLSDNPNNLDKWDFPEGTTIEGGGYLIIWADEDGPQEGLHANFKLSAAGEEIYLVSPDTTVILDQIVYGEQMTDLAYARQPNGTGDFVIKEHTFNENNDIIINTTKPEWNSPALAVFPNPATDMLTIELSDSDSDNMDIRLFDAIGRLVKSQQTHSNQLNLSVQDLSEGVYFLMVNHRFSEKIVLSR